MLFVVIPFRIFSFISLTWVTNKQTNKQTNTLSTARGSSAGLYWLRDTSVITDSCQTKWRPSIKVALRAIKCFSSDPQVTYYCQGCKWWHIRVSGKNFVRLYFRTQNCTCPSEIRSYFFTSAPQRTASTNFAKQPRCFHIHKGNYLSQTKGVYSSRCLWKPNSRGKYRCHPRS